MENLALAPACPRCAARTRSGGGCLGADAEWQVLDAWRCLTRRATGRGQRHVQAWLAFDRGDRAAPEDDGRDKGTDQCSILYRNSQQTHDYDGIVGGCDPNTPSENVARGDTQLVRGR